MTYRTHLDYASSAPIRDIVRSTMLEELSSKNDFFDPRRLYDDAIKIRYEIEESRQNVANFFGSKSSEVIFTSSSTESLAMFANGIAKMDDKIFVSSFESEIVLRNLDYVKYSQIEMVNLITKLPLDAYCVFISYAHPDTGEIVDVDSIVKTIRSINPNCLIHLDARSACGYSQINFADLDVDAMTVSSETFGGPVGISALILRQGLHIEPLIKGATQERARRSGVENTLAIKGFGALCTTEHKVIEDEIHQFNKFKKTIISILKDNDLKIISENENSLPNIISTMVPGVAASAIVAEFNRRQINIHAGSSCGSEEFEISQALINIGLSESEAECVFRISWGYATSDEDMDNFAISLKEICSLFTTKYN